MLAPEIFVPFTSLIIAREGWFSVSNMAATQYCTNMLLKYDEAGFTQNFKSCFRASYSKSFHPHGSLRE